MNPYRDIPSVKSPVMLARIKFPLEEILDINVNEYCGRTGIPEEYYTKFSIIYSCYRHTPIDVPKGTESVIAHKLVMDKTEMYCICIAMIPKRAFSF